MQTLLKPFHKNCRGRNTSKLMLRPASPCGQNQKKKKITEARKLQASNTDKHRCKTLNELTREFRNLLKGPHMIKRDLSQGQKDGSVSTY